MKLAEREAEIFSIIKEKLPEEGEKLVAELESLNGELGYFDKVDSYSKGLKDGMDLNRLING